jgi:hypothetical protein
LDGEATIQKTRRQGEKGASAYFDGLFYDEAYVERIVFAALCRLNARV